MQCLKCVHKIVCKHYSYATDNNYIGIKISDCKLYNPEIQNSITGTSVISKPTTIQDKNPFVLQGQTAPTALLKNSAGYPDFSSLSESKKPISAVPVEINKATCDRCKKEVFSTELDNCSECGRPVCMDCKVSSFDASLGTVTSVCEKCWSGTADPVPGEEKEVSISFEEQNETWNLQDFIDENTKEEEDNVTRKQVENRTSNRKSKEK